MGTSAYTHVYNDNNRKCKDVRMDLRIADILHKEEKRQNSTIELIASENFASQEVMNLAEVSLLTSMRKGTQESATTMVVLIWMR